MAQPDTEASLLVVDDEPEIGNFVVAVAQECGYVAEAATSAADFRRRFTELSPSHVLLDLQMPDADGIEQLGFLADHGCRAAIMIMSGVDQKILESARQFGVARGLDIIATLQKPVRAADLMTILEKAKTESSAIDRRTLEGAITKGELTLFFQPKVAIGEHVSDGGSHTGFEALVRWQRPRHGIVSPDAFLPAVESFGLMDSLTDSVLDMALAQSKEWRDHNINVTLGVNISSTNLRAKDFADRLMDRCRAHDVSPGNIVIELTETAAMQDPILAMETLTRIRLKGFHLSIDDFGTGYSSLVQLQRLPFSELKIDRAFVKDCHTSPQARVIVKTMVDLAHNLGLIAVAEGVENAAILQVLAELGCDIAQGYHIGKPMPSGEAAAWYASDQPGASL